MKTVFRRPAARSFLPGYSHNAVLQLIVATGVCFVAFFFTAVGYQAFAHYSYAQGVATLMPYVALQPPQAFLPKVWTVITYSFFHAGFFDWVSNAIWLYCWGGVVQMLSGYRQVIPVFVWGGITAGLFWLAVQLVPGVQQGGLLLGAQAGIMALAVAAFTLSPDFRFWFGPGFSLSIKVVGGIFLALSLLGVGMNAAGLAWLAGGGLAGFLYVRALRSGYRPGEWAYDLFDRASTSMEPKGPKPASSIRRGPVLQRRDSAKPGVSRQARLDDLLEKIHQKGYDSLSREEKEFLTRASQKED